MDKKEIISIATNYAKLVKSKMNVENIILYGSFAKGTAKEFSDIDIAVIVKKYPRNTLSTETKLFTLKRSIDSRIEPVLLSSSEDKSGFLDEIFETGIQL